MRGILFDTTTDFGQIAGVMVGWIGMSCGTLVLFTWWMRRRELAALLQDASTAEPSLRGSREDVRVAELVVEEAKKA